MALYKSCPNSRKRSLEFTPFAVKCLESDQETNLTPLPDIDENTIDFIENKFAFYLYESPADDFDTIQTLIEMILSYPDTCFQYILPEHIKKIILLNENENSILLLDIILQSYPSISQSDVYFELSESLYNNIAHFFSVKTINDNIIHLKNIIFNSVYDEKTRDLFYKSQCMEKINKHIENYEDDQDELLIVSLEILRALIRIRPIPNEFEIYISSLLEISTFDKKESVLSLKILIKITKYSSIDISNYITVYGGIETTYIEDLVSFIHENYQVEKRIASFQFLSSLSKYGDSMLKIMIDNYALFNAKKSLNDKKDEIIIEALNFFLNWVVNAEEYKFYLFDQICSFDFTDLCEKSSYQVKYHFLNLMLYLSKDALPEQLLQLFSVELLNIIIDQLDEDNQEMSQIIFEFLNFIVNKCYIDSGFIQFIKNELEELVFKNPALSEMQFNLLETMKLSMYS